MPVWAILWLNSVIVAPMAAVYVGFKVSGAVGTLLGLCVGTSVGILGMVIFRVAHRWHLRWSNQRSHASQAMAGLTFLGMFWWQIVAGVLAMAATDWLCRLWIVPYTRLVPV